MTIGVKAAACDDFLFVQRPHCRPLVIRGRIIGCRRKGPARGVK